MASTASELHMHVTLFARVNLNSNTFNATNQANFISGSADDSQQVFQSGASWSVVYRSTCTRSNLNEISLTCLQVVTLHAAACELDPL